MTQQTDRLNTALAGRYRIERHLGEGGMASVYLCEDLKHDRKVALKLLKPELAAVLGADRFVVEIKTTASLQHPHILPLFDSGTADGFLYYVMPLVEGETLRERLNRETQLGVDEAVRIAREVLDALQYAHDHGIVHRDVKPENILLHGGHAMVADFGIALAVSAAAGGRMTETGLSLGTPHYMSPEQATAEKEITPRSDVYSLGAVLYEMLTGNPPHVGSSAQQIIMRIIVDPVRPVNDVRKTVPPNVVAAVARSLEKLPADRFESARAFAEALGNPVYTSGHVATSLDRPARDGVSRRLFAVTAAAAVVLLGVVVSDQLRPAARALRAHLTFALGDSTPLAVDERGVNLALSPDGSQFAWVSGATTPRVYLRSLDGLAAQPLVGTENATNLQFSPDGKWLAFVVGSRLKKVSIGGGQAVDIVDDVRQFSWGDGDVIVLSRGPPNAGLWRTSAAGATPERLTKPDVAIGQSSHNWPHLLPGAKGALFAIRKTVADFDSLAVVTLADGHVTRLGILGTNPRYVAPGYLLFGRTDGTVSAAPFDARALRVAQPIVPVLDNVPVLRGTKIGQGGATSIAVARNGTVVYAQGRSDGQLVTADRAGRLAPVSADTRLYADLRYSPDGRRLALTIFESAGRASDIWIRNIAEGTLTRFTNDGRSDRPSWTPDGRRLAWRVRNDTAAYDMKWAPADGSGAAEVLIRNAWSAVFAPSGTHAYVTVVRPATGGDIDVVSLDSTKKVTPFARTEATEHGQKVSPDGAWVAYVSAQSGRNEVYVRAATGETGLHQVSTDGATEPVWSPNGRELYYRGDQKFLAAQIATRPAFTVVRRDTLFIDSFVPGLNYAAYDVSPDGKRFVLVKLAARIQHPVIAFGWLDELRDRMNQGAKP